MAALGVAVVFCGVALAHNGEPPPIPMPPAGVPVRVNVHDPPPPPRWSWIHWWEANRDRFLRSTPSQDPTTRQSDDPAQLEALRYEAAKAITDAMTSRGATKSLVTECALALGKMRRADSLDSLKRLIDQSESGRARTPLIASLGLLGTPQAEAALQSYHSSHADDEAAAFAATGLLPTIGSETLRRLRGSVDAEDPGVATAVCFALRQHHDKNNAAYYQGLLKTNDSTWVASEALLALGNLHDRDSTNLLEAVLFGDPDASVQVRAWATLARMSLQSSGDTSVAYEAQYERYRQQYAEWKKRNPNSKRDPGLQAKAKAVDGGEITLGFEQLDLAWLRSSAAIALGEVNTDRAASALSRFVTPARQDDDAYKVTPRGFAIMSLTAYPSDATCDQLIGILSKRDEGGKQTQRVQRDSPLRGFAALALGLYARPHDTAQGAADRPGFDRAIVTLAERLEDGGEDQEVRTACALALGLTQRTVVLPVLIRAGDAIHQRSRKQDLVIYGYLMLGRALVGDHNVVDAAGRFVQSEDDTSMTGILARRAAVLAMGVPRDSVAIPILTRAWNLNYYVNREVIVALRLLGGPGAAAPLLQRLRESTDAEERAYMAQALGELLAVDAPTPLARFTAGCNYTVRNDKLMPLQRLANGFLYDYLIPTFGESW